MNSNKNNNIVSSIVIAAIIAIMVAFIWAFGNNIFSIITNFTVPENTSFAIWKLFLVIILAGVIAIIAERYSLKSTLLITSAFVLMWFIIGSISANYFEIGLAVIPIIFVSFLTVAFIHLKKLWQIDRDLTKKLVYLASTGHLLEGKPADLRIDSGFKLLETIFPVSEIIYFRCEVDGSLNPVGRQRKDKKDNTLSSRQNAWHKCVELCEMAFETRETQIQRDQTSKDAAKIALPLISNEEIIGVLFIDVRQDFENNDINLLESFSQQIARTFKRKDLRSKKLPHQAWWNSFSTYSLENRLDITSLVHSIIREQSFSTIAGSYLNEAHAIAYLDGSLVYVNRRMKKLAKLEIDEMPDTDLFNLLGKFKTDVFNEPSLAIRRVMQTGDSFQCELAFPEEFKTLSMQINLVKVPIKNSTIHETQVKKIPACFLITFSDITALKENEKLRSDIAHLMSHELRTPITSIQGFAEMILLEDNIPEDSKDFLNTIVTESQRASKILSNFLSVANLQQADKQEVIITHVEVNDVVREVVEDFGKTAKQKRIRIVDKRSKDIPAVAADRGLLTKAISHLVDNAIRYSPERTSVMISTILEADFLRVEVEDRGYGIPKGDQEKIWQKFYRVERDGQEKEEDTTGLGLSLVKEIIEQHKGEVKVQSVEGRGSRFSFRLPRL